jgi:hypothetical protein
MLSAMRRDLGLDAAGVKERIDRDRGPSMTGAQGQGVLSAKSGDCVQFVYG